MSAAPGPAAARGRVELGDYPVDAAWSPDGTVAAGRRRRGGAAAARGDARCRYRAIGAHEGGVLAVAWQKAGALFASSGQDGCVRLWDARTLHGAGTSIARSAWSEQLAFADSGRLLAVASGRELRLFDAQGRAAPQPSRATAAPSRRSPGAPEHRDRGRGQWRRAPASPRAGAPVARPRVPRAPACIAQLERRWPRARRGACRMAACICGTSRAAASRRCSGFGSKVLATEWSANGRYLATAAGATVVVWDFGGKRTRRLASARAAAHSERITALRFPARPRHLAGLRGARPAAAAVARGRLAPRRRMRICWPMSARGCASRAMASGSRWAMRAVGVSLFDCAS